MEGSRVPVFGKSWTAWDILFSKFGRVQGSRGSEGHRKVLQLGKFWTSLKALDFEGVRICRISLRRERHRNLLEIAMKSVFTTHAGCIHDTVDG